jgi:hypothetical protein
MNNKTRRVRVLTDLMQHIQTQERAGKAMDVAAFGRAIDAYIDKPVRKGLAPRAYGMFVVRLESNDEMKVANARVSSAFGPDTSQLPVTMMVAKYLLGKLTVEQRREVLRSITTLDNDHPIENDGTEGLYR